MGTGISDEVLKEAFQRYLKNPVLFVSEVFKVKPTEHQAEVLMSLVAEGAHVTVRSGHGTGKSAVLSWIVLWGLLLHDDVKIPCTAPSSHQLFDVLWSEIAKWHERMPPLLRRLILVQSSSICVVGHEKTRFAAARTARKENPDALQGFHAKTLIYLIDEASGIYEKIFMPVEGALSTPGAKIIMCGNPTRTEGYFYRSHVGKEAKYWKSFMFSSAESPLVGEKYPRQMAEKYGKDSNIYKVRVLGEFPTSSYDTLIPLEWVESARGRDVKYPQAKRIAGLDIARFGDDKTAFLSRQGGRLFHIDLWYKQDLMDTCGRVVAAFREKKLFDVVYADVIGLGSGVVDRLREMEVPVIGVNVSEGASIKPKFNRMRDELWWKCREWFESQMCRLEPNMEHLDDLEGELTSIKYRFTSSGKIRVESKDDLKKRASESPNIADALCLTFAEGYRSSNPMENRLREVKPPVNKGAWS